MSPFDRLDDNKDGKVSKDEVMQHFDKIDADNDGSLTKVEIRKAIQPQRQPSESRSGQDRPSHPTGPQDSKPTADRPTAREDRHPEGPPFVGRPNGPRPDGRGPFGGPGIPAGQIFGLPHGPMGNRPGFGFAGPQEPFTTEELFNRFDGNKDGKLTESEVVGPVWRRYSNADTNHDGAIGKDELESFRAANRPRTPSDVERRPDESRKPDEPRKPNESRKSGEPKNRKPPESNSSSSLSPSGEIETDIAERRLKDQTGIDTEGTERPIADAINPSIPSRDVLAESDSKNSQETQ